MIEMLNKFAVPSHPLLAVATVIALAATLVPEAAAQRICRGGKLAGANQPCGLQTATAKKEGKGARSVSSGRVTGLAADPSDPAAAKCKNKVCTGKLRANPAQKEAKDNKHLNVESWSWGSK
jgi:hypothetical protein